MKAIRFIFDLDGTLTTVETLPVIARHFGLSGKLEKATRRAVLGGSAFEDSLLQRVHLLKKFPVSEINRLLGTIPIYPNLLRFISENSGLCQVATANIDVWIHDLMVRIGCPYHSSRGRVENDRLVEVSQVLDKAGLVRGIKREGMQVVFIGDGANDQEAMRLADVAIAAAMTHRPAPEVRAAAAYLVHTDKELYDLLNRLLHT